MGGAENPEENPGEPTGYSQYAAGEWQEVSGTLPEEMSLHLFVNGEELATLLCTPDKLNCLVLGFLRSEGLISDLSEVTMMRVCEDESLAEVRVAQPVKLPGRRIITSGCGSGVTFDLTGNIPPVESDLRISTDRILSAMMLLQGSADGRRERAGIRRGVHASALSNGQELIVRADDIGRHNTLDKIWGECMLRRIPTADRLLLTTGRISSEMLIKAARMRTPVVASINSATRQAVLLGTRLGITVVGYARGSRLSVYSLPGRILGCPAKGD